MNSVNKKIISNICIVIISNLLELIQYHKQRGFINAKKLNKDVI